MPILAFITETPVIDRRLPRMERTWCLIASTLAQIL